MIGFEYNVLDTIAALSTPPGKGAISIIRISGPRSFPVITSIFRPALKLNISRKNIHYGYLTHNKKILDHILLLTKKGPNSYTGDDLVEIHCHGNPLITQSVLNTLLIKKIRMALPGEFTFRAVINKKMNLIQAEALNELINSKNYLSLQIAMNNFSGRFTNEMKDMIHQLKKILISLEIDIDHSEENIQVLNRFQIFKTIKKYKNKVSKLINYFHIQQKQKHDITIVITGHTNVGKSSLFNLLIKRDKSIISHIPGTTRDVIEEYIEINNKPVKIIDTAGIKRITNPIDALAVKKTNESIQSADIILYVLDNSKPLLHKDKKLITLINQSATPLLVVINKIDLTSRLSACHIRSLFKNRTIIKTSVSRETGILNLEKRINQLLLKHSFKKGSFFISIRQKEILMRIDNYLDEILQHLKKHFYPDIIAINIKNIISLLYIITGEYTTDHMLNDIFSNFCIGK